MKLIVMVPALNEEATIARIVERVPRSLAGIEETEVLVINDGSTDNTALEARRAGAALVTLPVRSGLGKVFRTGLEHAMRRGADLVVTIDGDGQFDPADIPKLVSPILEGRADFVTCTRFADPEARPRMSLVKYYGNRLVTRIINWTCDTRFTDVSCGFRAFNREVVYKLTLFGNFTYTQETFIDLVSKGLRIAEVPLPVRGEREFGKSRVASNIFKYGCNSLAIILRTVRDTNPLKFFGGIGLCVGLLGAGLAAFIAGWWLRYGRTSPFTSLVPVSGV
ncbi:MAG TPA: glycosyltransferase family 2 protein, partial [Dehalococcoidia bacterium]|nr:glycosyltransferase family 2 protein [Dehalococcoidia bacterium]